MRLTRSLAPCLLDVTVAFGLDCFPLGKRTAAASPHKHPTRPHDTEDAYQKFLKKRRYASLNKLGRPMINKTKLFLIRCG